MRMVVERDEETGLLLGSVPGIPGAQSQGRTYDELERNVQQALSLALEAPLMEALGMFLDAGVISDHEIASFLPRSGTLH